MVKVRDAANRLVDVVPMMRDASNALVEVEPVVRDPAGVLVGTVPSVGSLSAGAVPANVNGAGQGSGMITVRTSETRVSVSGGVPPYRFAWEGGPDLVPSAATSDVTRFYSEVAPEQDKSGTFMCTVTDARSSTAVTNTVTASVFNYGGAGGPFQ